MTLTIQQEDPSKPDILDLLAEGEAYGAALYPAESNHFLALDAMRQPNVQFVTARRDDGMLLGIGAIVLSEAWVEIKRMWVVPQARGQGVAARVLADLERRALAAGYDDLRLETGIHNHEALRLYARAGFQPCGAFGAYGLDPMSVFMRKTVRRR